VVNTLKILDQLPEVEPSDIDQPDNIVVAEMGEILQDQIGRAHV
jgi:hypothetical protein